MTEPEPAEQQSVSLEALLQPLQHYRHALECLPSLPLRNNARLPPQTYSEALALIQAHDEEKRRKETRKGPQKQKSVASQADELPQGAVPGPPDNSAFWQLREVRRALGLGHGEGDSDRFARTHS